MAKKPVLVVMAAGMGSRYGGLKQIDAVGSCGEAILDYSLYDAKLAGFETAVIIIKEAIREEFMQTVGKRLEKCPLEIRYAYQELWKLPAGYTVPEGRTKPFGTSHAVLCAKEEIDGAPFAVINADDYYGRAAFKTVYDALCADTDPKAFCMVGYELGKTVTEHGSVARGVCKVSESGYLTHVDERTRIEKRGNAICYTEDGENWVELPPESTVSMNLWGLTSHFLAEAEAGFPAFLDQMKDPMKSEYLLPILISAMVHQGKATVQVLTSPDKWYGVTYAADKPIVQAAVRELTEAGLYPDGLWK